MVLETTHTPQGDGNLHLPLLPNPLSPRNNPHPARGRKPLIARGGGSALTETTHTPQGDGNLDGIEPVADLGRNNPHPARGRKLTINQYRACIAGNNPHPARGRKPFVCVKLAVALEKQPTPRKGTETFPRRHFCNDRSGNNPHPARGRKLWRPSSPSDMILKQPTPRKGTETRCSRRSCRCNLETTHTPQGDGNKAGHIQIRLYLETTHTPQGDGNCHRQRVAAIQRKQPTPRKGTETRLLEGMSLGVLETTHTPQGDGKPFVFTLQKLLEKPFTSPTGDN